MDVLGYLGAGVMGLTLGLVGGGGSILAVPVLVYFFGIPGAQATFLSLFVVGLCAAVGTLPFARRGLVSAKTGMIFFLPSVIGALVARRVILPAVPERLSWVGLSLSKDGLILLAFGLVMLAASGSMLLGPATDPPRGSPSVAPSRIAVTGVGVGLVTGFVGAGGGFLIVPALVNGLWLPMDRAIGTSLLIIALNSLIGFGADVLAGQVVDWALIMPFSVIALGGLVAGTQLNRLVPAARLKPAFGWFVLAIGIAMVAKQALVIR